MPKPTLKVEKTENMLLHFKTEVREGLELVSPPLPPKKTSFQWRQLKNILTKSFQIYMSVHMVKRDFKIALEIHIPHSPGK